MFAPACDVLGGAGDYGMFSCRICITTAVSVSNFCASHFHPTATAIVKTKDMAAFGACCGAEIPLKPEACL